MTGQTPFRTGLLEAKGYMTGQFGKNHLGDRDEHLPTAHGFDEFFGSQFPPRQKTGSSAIDQALESLTRGAGDR